MLRKWRWSCYSKLPPSFQSEKLGIISQDFPPPPNPQNINEGLTLVDEFVSRKHQSNISRKTLGNKSRVKIWGLRWIWVGWRAYAGGRDWPLCLHLFCTLIPADNKNELKWYIKIHAGVFVFFDGVRRALFQEGNPTNLRATIALQTISTLSTFANCKRSPKGSTLDIYFLAKSPSNFWFF
jgi:hypothetical protein